MSTLINWLSALAVRFTPTGNIAATNVQGAIEELDTETVKLSNDQSINGIKTFNNRLLIEDVTESGNYTNGSFVTKGGISSYRSISAGSTIRTGHTFAFTASTGGLSFIRQFVANTSITIDFSGASAAGTFYPSGGVHIGASPSDPGAGNLRVSGNTSSTSTTTGCATFAGGIGVTGAGYFLNEVSSRSLLVGENAVKTVITSTDSGGINEIFIGRQSPGATILSFPTLSSMGVGDNEIRLYRSAGTEYLRLLAPRGGASGQNNVFLFDIIGNSAPTTRPLQFRFINTESGGATINALRLHNTGRVSINSTVDNGVDQLQVSGSTISTQYKLSTLNTAPSSATDTGTLGEIRIDADYIYMCVATDTWKRSALTTW